MKIPSQRTTRLELHKEDFKFSAGHFTMFSPTNREHLHGHNFTVFVGIDSHIRENGLTFDYGLAKKHISTMCKQLSETFLIPQNSKYLKFYQEHGYEIVEFNGEKIPFLKRDIKYLPVENISVEDLSSYFLNEFLRTFVKPNNYGIFAVDVKVYSGPGQCGVAYWKSDEANS